MMSSSEVRIHYRRPNAAPVLFFFVFLFWAGAVLHAQTEKKPAVLAEIEKIETRLAKIEEDQKLILQKQETILEQIKNLKIWVRRN